MASSTKLVALLFLAFAVTLLPPSEASAQAPHLSPVLPASPPEPPQAPVVLLPGTTPPPPPQQPTACLTPLLPVMPCMDYLTNLTVLDPPSTCCDGLKSVINDAPICLCHGLNGDMDRLLRDPIDPIRMVMLPLACGTMMPLLTLLGCATQNVPPLMPSPVAPVPPTPSSP